jgi:hypothetical protein
MARCSVCETRARNSAAAARIRRRGCRRAPLTRPLAQAGSNPSRSVEAPGRGRAPSSRQFERFQRTVLRSTAAPVRTISPPLSTTPGDTASVNLGAVDAAAVTPPAATRTSATIDVRSPATPTAIGSIRESGDKARRRSPGQTRVRFRTILRANRRRSNCRRALQRARP